jgi:MraZ protein
MLLFVGRFQHSLDVKGRLILPAKFREDFLTGGYATPSEEGCLALWTPAEFVRQSEHYASQYASGGASGRSDARYWASSSQALEFDKQGRFGLTKDIREFAGLDDEVLITGALNHVELWSPERYALKVLPAAESFRDGDA